VRGVGRIDTACCDEVILHRAREADKAGEEERGAGFHGDSSAGEDEAVVPALVGDSGGVSHDRGKITFQIQDECLKFQGVYKYEPDCSWQSHRHPKPHHRALQRNNRWLSTTVNR
jgi:hypothetical protein